MDLRQEWCAPVQIGLVAEAMAVPLAQLLTFDELRVRLASYGAVWVDQPDPSGGLHHGYFERVIKGRPIGAPLSVPLGTIIMPRLLLLLLQRLDIPEDDFSPFH